LSYKLRSEATQKPFVEVRINMLQYRKASSVLWFPVVLLAAGAVALGFHAKPAQSDNDAQTGPAPVQPSASTLSLQEDLVRVAQKLRPSVVMIKSVHTLRNVSLQGNPFIVPQIPQFQFPPNGGPFPNIQIQPAPNVPSFPQRATAAGSGVIVRSDGYVITNDHVVAGADKVTVQLMDGRTFVGKVYRDPRSDLALIKINADNLPAVQFANSDDVKVGELALAFGSPFELSDTMTMGIVSSLHRHFEVTEGTNGYYYPDLIQTDASINPGNSGGPLVDIYGRVIGINTAIESQTGGNVGIGFAIPSNTVRYVMDQLIAKGRVVRGYLGVVPSTLSYDQAQMLGVKQGAFIQMVEDGSPAAKAGMQAGDVVIRFNNQPVTDEASFRDLVARTAPGTTVPVEVYRDGHDLTLNVTVGEAPSDKTEQPQQQQEMRKARGRMGIEIGDASDPDIRKKFQLNSDVKSGVVVLNVYPNSPAADAGIQPGDVIIALNGKPIKDAQALSDALAAEPSGATVRVTVRRFSANGPGETLVLFVTLY
jgi:serine protease Do